MALRPRQRDARRAVWCLVATFLAVQGTASVLVDRLPEPLRFPELARSLAGVEARGRLDLVLLGSSRSGPVPSEGLAQAVHEASPLQPPPSVANLAVGAGDALTSDHVLARLLERAAPPRLVVLELAPEALSARGIYVKAAIARSLTWPDIVASLPGLAQAHAASILASTRLIPLYAYRSAFLAWASGQALMEAPAGSIEPGHQAERAARLGRILRSAGPGGLPGTGLERLLARCRGAGIAVVVLLPPASAPLRAQYTPQVERAFQDFLASRAPGVPVLDVRAALPDDAFTDEYHLQPRAVPGYTRDLGALLAGRLGP